MTVHHGSSADLAAWDRSAGAYAAAIGGPDDFRRRFEPFLDRWLPGGAPRVLDLGCGHGWLAGLLSARGAHVVGVDGSAGLVARAGHAPRSAVRGRGPRRRPPRRRHRPRRPGREPHGPHGPPRCRPAPGGRRRAVDARGRARREHPAPRVLSVSSPRTTASGTGASPVTWRTRSGGSRPSAGTATTTGRSPGTCSSCGTPASCSSTSTSPRPCRRTAHRRRSGPTTSAGSRPSPRCCRSRRGAPDGLAPRYVRMAP